MRARLPLVSLVALAFADAAVAQPTPTAPTTTFLEGPAVPAAILPAALPPAPAPVPTDIVPDEGDALSLGTQVTQSGTTYAIDGGTRAGNNLFHSFSRFDLGEGDFARWVHSAGDPLTVRNVVNRVTGGDPSHIFGTLDSTALPNADFFFINPAGIVFGESARIDVPAAAHFSTAQAMRFRAGPNFTVSTPSGSTFSVANPAAFGFVGGQGDVAMRGATNTPFTGTRLTLTGRNVAVENSIMGADGFGIAAVGSGTTALSVDNPRATSGDGEVRIENSVLRSRALDGILISGSRVEIDRTSLGAALTPGPRSGVGGPIDIAGREVSIHASSVSASTAGAEAAGDIRITGDDVRLSGGTIVQSETDRGSIGTAGGINISADTLTLEGGAVVSTSTSTAERAGLLTINANELTLLGGSILSQSTTGAEGDAGLILISRQAGQAGRLFLTGESAIRSDTNGSGNAGGILILMDEVELRNGGTISSDAGRGCIATGCGPLGQSGNIRIMGGNVLLADDDPFSVGGTGISSDTFGGNGGRISFSLSGDLTILGSGRVSSDTIAVGRGGDIRVDAENIRVAGTGGGFSSTTHGTGAGGSIELLARNSITIEQDAAVKTESGDILVLGGGPPRQGGSGSILLSAPEVVLATGGSVSASTFTDGAAGSVEVRAGLLEMSSAARIASSSFSAGRGGLVQLEVGELRMRGFAMIETDSVNQCTFCPPGGDAGNILINAGSIDMEGFADPEFGSEERPQISSDTNTDGAGGNITINLTGRLGMALGTIASRSTSRGAGGSITINAPLIDATLMAEITTETFGPGAAGSIKIASQVVRLDDLALLTSATQGLGAGGSIAIKADQLIVTGGAVIDADSLLPFGGGQDGESGPVAGGKAGEIDIDVRRLVVSGDDGRPGPTASRVSSSTVTTGDAGALRISANELVMDGGQILSATASMGNAGTITIRSDDLTLNNSAAISTRSSPCFAVCSAEGGNAGNIDILARRTATLDGASRINSDTDASGAAGSIVLRGGDLAVRGGSLISSETRGSGDAGSILIETNRLELTGFENSSGTNYSTISSATFDEGDAGSITISADRVQLDRGRIRSNTLGSGDAGSVTIAAGDISVTRDSQVLSDSRPSAPVCQDVCFESNAGSILITATRSLALTGESLVASSTGTRGAAGSVGLTAPSITLDDAVVSSSSVGEGTGKSGTVAIDADALRLTGRSSIETISNNSNEAGGIRISADQIVVSGESARISSSNESEAGGDAGGIFITSDDLQLLEGGRLTSSSVAGAAGAIEIFMSRTGLLRLESSGAPSEISTSSGPGTGGRIFIASPRAIISNGGSILALGQQGGANVILDAQYLISSSDRTNRIEVSGNFLLEAAAYDVSAGTVNRDLSVIDASGVLRGQCAAVRATGEVSQLVVRPIGPYGARPSGAAPARNPVASVAGLSESCS